MEVNFSGFKLEKSLPNIRRRKSLPYVHVPHKTQIGTFSVDRIRAANSPTIKFCADQGRGRGGGVCLQGNLWYSPPASMTSRLASVTFKMASKVFTEETNKNVDFVTDILFRFLGIGYFKVSQLDLSTFLE